MSKYRIVECETSSCKTWSIEEKGWFGWFILRDGYSSLEFVNKEFELLTKHNNFYSRKVIRES